MLSRRLFPYRGRKLSILPTSTGFQTLQVKKRRTAIMSKVNEKNRHSKPPKLSVTRVIPLVHRLQFDSSDLLTAVWHESLRHLCGHWMKALGEVLSTRSSNDAVLVAHERLNRHHTALLFVNVPHLMHISRKHILERKTTASVWRPGCNAIL